MCGLRLTVAFAVGAAFACAAESTTTTVASVPKCCPDGMMGFPSKKTGCFKSSDPILDPFLPWNDLPTYVKNISCSKYTSLDSSEYTVAENGDLILNPLVDDPSDMEERIEKDSYCFDVQDQSYQGEGESSSGPPEYAIVPIICFEKDPGEVPSPYPIGMIVSVPFLAATAITYAVIRKLRNLHGRCLVFECTSLALAYTFLINVILFPDIESDSLCRMLEKYGLFDNESWRVTEGGLVVLNGWTSYTATDYCVDDVLHYPNGEPVGVRAFLCFQDYCENGRYLTNDGDEWEVTTKGLQLASYSHDGVRKVHTNPDYCLEDIMIPEIRPRGVYALLCHMIDHDIPWCSVLVEGDPRVCRQEIDFVINILYPMLDVMGALLVLLTLVLYIKLICPRSRFTIAQKAINVCYMIALSTFLLLQSVADIFIDPNDLPKSCVVLGFAVQFFFLATFFWLNVMCIDIYWAFSDLRSLGGSAGTWRDQRKLLYYSAYAWGMPLLILCITIAVDYTPSVPTTSRFKPAMGEDKCFFRGRTAGWTYFYGPMAVILLINCLLFAITAFHLYRHRRDAGFSNRGDSRRHGGGNDKERFNLYLKLFIVMGINWLSEVVSFTFNTDVPRYLWYLTDITNTLQGVFIFLIFVWKQRVRQLIWDKLCKGNRSGSTANNTSSTSITTNSTRSHHNSIKMANINNVTTAPINCGSDVDDDESDQD